MATPPRLVELRCQCLAAHWKIDHDYRGTHGEEEPYEARVYSCTECGFTGAGFTLLRKSPPTFFLQPHPLYPMTQQEFESWVAVVQEHFPDHPLLNELRRRWYPELPA